MRRMALVCVMAACLSAPAWAATVTFTTIADTSTVMPGWAGTFTGFSSVSMNGGDVAFVGRGNNWGGVYVLRDGAITKIVDMNTAMPDRGVNFSSFSGPVSLDNGNIAFAAGGSLGGGVYTNLGGSLRAVASYAITPIPDGTGKFTGMDQPSITGGNIAFNGYGSNGQAGVYVEKSGLLTKAVDTNTYTPSGTGKFITISGTPGQLDRQGVAFRGTTSTEHGIYTSTGGDLVTVADLTTNVPGGAGTFTGFDNPSMDGGAVAFRGVDEDGWSGIYTDLGGILRVVADMSTGIPDGVGSFGGFDTHPSIDGNNIAFGGSFAGQNAQDGVYVSLDGALMKIIDRNDSLDGKTPVWFGLFAQSLSGNSLAFNARFADGSEGIYLASFESAAVPEPNSLALLSGLGVMGLAGRRRRRTTV